MDKKLSIGRLAEMTGVLSKTIRYYEEVGIVPPPERTESHYRMYELPREKWRLESLSPGTGW